MNTLAVHVGDRVEIKRKKEYGFPRLAEHAGKIGRITRVGGEGTITLHLEPQTIGFAYGEGHVGVTRGRNSQGLRLTVGLNDIEHVKKESR